MSQIKFGTDGWRAIIAKDYTVDNVSRIAEGTARWMLIRKMKQAVIGYDCRFGGKMFAETTAQVFGNFGIKVIMSPDFVSTPMVSLATVKTQSDMGIVITASHNPPSYNGFKLKSAYGGPTIPSEVAEVESLIPDTRLHSLPSIQELTESGILTYLDMEQMYMDHVEANFDIKLMQTMGKHIAYDAMYGAGQNAMKRLFADATMLHAEYNPSFLGQAPEPIEKNLQPLADLIKSNPNLTLGIAHDGDADRIGMYDEDGNFVDSHHILLLLLYYLVEYKKEHGKVVVTFSVTDKMQKLAEHYGLPFEVTKIGFKYIAEIMTSEKVIVGGEESGGLAVYGHIPERDGIWIGLMIMEFMARTGKTVKQLVQDVYQRVGSFAFDRNDLHLTNEKKLDIISKCQSGHYNSFGPHRIQRVEDLDGFKYFIADDQWLMIRPSGTEPVLRVYAQAPDKATATTILKHCVDTLLGA